MTEWALWRGLAVLTALLYAGLAWIVFSDVMPGAGGLMPFDGRVFGYSVAEARAFLDALTPEARETYLGPARLLDTVFPLALGALLAWPLWRLSPSPWRILAALALGYVAADLVENAAVAGMLRETGPVTPATIQVASRLTVAKYVLLIGSVIALGAIFVRTRRP
ncbi:hypothetical protein [Hasllibacter sp. MH4015]|uniref:hypothetical protein n=1 Tax=Hasllibacter sp. MH4015 TaxID=2854029 RepID=UPI001CD1DC73|nr:hypothetical protein [Hasllibacter sp. MH4015]